MAEFEEIMDSLIRRARADRDAATHALAEAEANLSALESTLALYRAGPAEPEADVTEQQAPLLTTNYGMLPVSDMLRAWAMEHNGAVNVNEMARELTERDVWPNVRDAGRSLHSRIVRMKDQFERVAPGEYRFRYNRELTHGIIVDVARETGAPSSGDRRHSA